MTNSRRMNPVHRSVSRPLTILGAERKLFFFAMCVGAGRGNWIRWFRSNRQRCRGVLSCSGTKTIVPTWAS